MTGSKAQSVGLSTLGLTCLVAIAGCSPRGIEVGIHNNSENRLVNVALNYGTQSNTFAAIEPHRAQVIRIFPETDSHIEVSYTDANALHFHHRCDNYMERGYTGKYSIVIVSNGVLRCSGGSGYSILW